MKKRAVQGDPHRHTNSTAPTPSTFDDQPDGLTFAGGRVRGSWRSQSDLQCHIGDLAIVVRSHNPSNLGKVVRVVSRYTLEAANYIPDGFHSYDWVVVTHGYLTWSQLYPYQRWRRKRGPVADDCLYPIRGLRMSNEALEKIIKRPGFGCRYYPHAERPMYALCM